MPDGIDYIIKEINRKLLLTRTCCKEECYRSSTLLIDSILENDIPKLVEEIKNERKEKQNLL